MSCRAARRLRSLLRCGQAAGPLFVATFLLDGTTRVGYRSARHPVSSLALGTRGWIQKTSFAVTGAMTLAGGVGLWRARMLTGPGAAGPALIGVAAMGMCAAAVFTTDPVSGYPPGTPDRPVHPSRAGALHDLVSVPIFLGLPAAAEIYGWRFARAGEKRWAGYSAATGFGMLAAFAASASGFNQSTRFVSTAGLWQRSCLMAGFGWLCAVFTRALRRS